MRELCLAATVLALLGCVRSRGGDARPQPASTDGGRDAGAAHDEGVTMSQDADGHGVELPKVYVEAAPRYLLGFPLFLAVTYDNPGADVDFYMLPELDLFNMPWGIGFHLAPTSGGAPVDLKAGRLDPELETETHGSVRAVPLAPHEKRRMLLDLSNFGVVLPPEAHLGPALLQPGTYRLTLVLRQGKETTSSSPVTVELAAATPEDAREAARLRTLGGRPPDTGSWGPFLTSNWSTVIPSPSLSLDAQRQLALHLFLHHAFYGPEPIAKLDEPLLGRITEPSLAADVAAFRYESLTARGAPDAKQALDDLLARWPGMRWRTAPGQGLLAAGRTTFGAEAPGRPHASLPYTK